MPYMYASGQLPDLHQLPALRQLSFCSWDLQEAAPIGLSALTCLEILWYAFCAMDDSIAGLTALKALQLLDIRGCSGLRDLTDLTALTGLKTLRLNACDDLVNMAGLSTLSSLKSVNIACCGQLQSDIYELRDMPFLEQVIIQYAPDHTHFKLHIDNSTLPALERTIVHYGYADEAEDEDD
eukprot:jgi/Chrzof1/8266/Cz03g03210.t1